MKTIKQFDEQSYLKANPDVQEAIDSALFRSAAEHVELVGFRELQEGGRAFHSDYKAFDEALYLELYPDIEKAVTNGDFKSAFEHFCLFGYSEIVTGVRIWEKFEGTTSDPEEMHLESVDESKEILLVTPQKVIAVVGIPRSGLTVTTAMLAGNCQASAWFLPYATRKAFGIEPFRDFDSIQKSYSEVFPNEEPLKNTLFISETTADLEALTFLHKSLKNLEESGAEVELLWITRDPHHTYISQIEAAHKYWGAENAVYDESTYHGYIDFLKNSYLAIFDLSSNFKTSLISYEKLVSNPNKYITSLYHTLNLSSNTDQNPLTLDVPHIVGDPSFTAEAVLNDRTLEREKKWSSISYLDSSLEGFHRTFVSAMLERKKLLCNASLPCSLQEYQSLLLEKHFDSDYYNSTYEDIKQNSVNPLEHYISAGWKEDRNPNDAFETRWYRENIFDDGMTPSYLHFLLKGQFEVVQEESIGIMDDLKIIDPESYVISDDLVLVAPKYKNPKVSIIIPAYNEEKYTMACIESIIKNSEDDVSYEIIIMDDKSPDESARLIERNLKNIKFITNGVNFGFLLNCNKGATFAIGEYLLFLNNDTNVQPGWLSSLVTLIESADDIGMVGSRLVYPTGQQQEAGGIVWNDASGWNFGRLDDPHKPEYNYVKEADYLTGAAMMIRSSLWEEIGGFDERYVPAYYEDTDLAFEVRKHGYRALYQPLSVVIHFEGISNGTDLGSGIKRYQVVNKENFFNKWKEELTKEQFVNAQDVLLARDRSGTKRHLLYVDHYLPHYDQDAGSKATFQYLQILTQNNIQVHFLGDNFYNYPDTPYLDALQQMGIEVLHSNWYAKNWKKWFAENGKYFDYAVLSRPHIASKYVETIRAHSDAKIIYMGHDLHFLREEREYKIKGDEKYLESSQKWQEAEMELIHQCDVSYFFSDVEKEEILKIDAKASVDVVPLYIYEQFKVNNIPSSKREDVMFVGGFAHSPNVDATLWFVQEIWPDILKALPSAKFYIIGSKAPDEILALASESIVVTGYIDDETLDAYYDKCKVVVAPLRYGAGIKGKIVDALYNGMPLVTTSIGAEGLQNSASSMLISDDPETFAKHVIELYTNETLADQYAQNALQYCKRNFSTQMAKEKMSNIFTEFKENR